MTKTNHYLKSAVVAISVVSLLFTSCGSKKTDETTAEQGELLKGSVKIDGSSTVYPISEAVAEEFLSTQPEVKVTVGLSGTGGGFKKFGRGEIDINDASRTIKEEEAKICTDNNIHYLELAI